MATDPRNKQAIDRLMGRIAGSIERQYGEIIEDKVKKIQIGIDKLQQRFFSELAQKAIGVPSAPDLGPYTPTWKPLSKDSYARKKAKRGNAGLFYVFRGHLRSSLRVSNAFTAFGRPTISLTSPRAKMGSQSVTIQNGRARIKKSGKFVKMANVNLESTIVVNLYPKVSEPIDSLHKRKAYPKYFSEKIAIKMTNFRGRQQRPILQQYMKWWLNVRARAIVQRNVRL